jgi:choline dehydrogenase
MAGMKIRGESDYVIVGGGSAGCALAARLTEDPATTVTLLEAGGDGRGLKVEMPAGAVSLVGHDGSDWRYTAEPDPTLGDRVLRWAAGKMLGGGSAINGQLYIRGLRSDYDDWAAQGCAGWGFEDVLPYFKKSEGYEGANPPPSHGTAGPLSVAPPRDTHPLLNTFIDAFQQLSVPRLADYCGGEQHGVFPSLATHRHGRRCSAAKAYLETARGRASLQIVTGAHVRRLTMESKRVGGAEFVTAGEVRRVKARREVIVCAGAIGSPALLLRSGIGDGDELQRLGIPLRHHLPGVGRNLQEHPAVLMSRFVNVPTYNSRMSAHHKVRFLLQYLLAKRGPLVSVGGQGIAFAKTDPALDRPDMQYHFSAAIYDLEDCRVVMQSRPGIVVAANVCRPRSRGRITISDATADARPVIRHLTYEDPRDMQTMIAGCKLGDEVFGTPAFRPYVTDRHSPAAAPNSDAQWEAFIRQKTIYAFHPAGSCRMGVGADAVVDPGLKVHGVAGLRVCDASIMPQLISANTNAACIMFGEKLADMIRRETSGAPRS